MLDNIKFELVRDLLSANLMLTDEDIDGFIECDLDFHYEEDKLSPYINNRPKLKQILIDSFCSEISKYVDDNLQSVRLYRAIALKSLSDLRLPIGECWSFIEDSAQIYEEDYTDSSCQEQKFAYLFMADIRLNEINFQKSFELYMTNSFEENELRISCETQIDKLFVKEGDGYVDLGIELSCKKMINQHSPMRKNNF